MALPGNVTLIWVRGHFVDGTGAPRTGKVKFTCTRGRLVDPDEDTIIQQGTITAVLDEDGKFAVQLIATDSAGVSPTNFEYKVDEPTYASYRLALPVATPVLNSPGDDLDGEQVVDLSDSQPLTGAPGVTVQLLKGDKGDGGDKGDTGASSAIGLLSEPILVGDAWSVTLTSPWGIDPSGVPYYDPAGAAPADAAVATVGADGLIHLSDTRGGVATVSTAYATSRAVAMALVFGS